MKKALSIILTASLAVGCMAGCGKSDQSDKKSTEKKEGQTLRVMMSSGDFGADTIKPALEKAAEMMGVTLEYDVIPDDQMLNVVNTQLATGNADDVILHNFGLTDISAKDLAPLEGEWSEKITSTTKPFISKVR